MSPRTRPSNRRAAPGRPGAAGLRPQFKRRFELVGPRGEDEPFLLVLRSVTCIPRRQEFALLAELRKANPRFPLVLVSTDDIADKAMADED